MLVLSRRLNEKILFPGIPAAVTVVSIKGGVVRLGIDAPPEVPILRGELQDHTKEWAAPEPPVAEPVPAAALPDSPPPLRDRLRDTSLGLGLVRLLLDAGQTEDAKTALVALQEQFSLLRRGMEAEQAPPSAAVSPRKPLKALLVEDDRHERELLANFLRMSGLEVDTAGDGADALDYLRTRGRPDVVLLDMGMPRVDGPTAVREIRRDPRCAGLKIIGVSGHLPDEFDLENGPNGIDRWFHKPFDPAMLVHDLTEELCGAPAT
jgi:two-component system, OmpR family, response regulator